MKSLLFVRLLFLISFVGIYFVRLARRVFSFIPRIVTRVMSLRRESESSIDDMGEGRDANRGRADEIVDVVDEVEISTVEMLLRVEKEDGRPLPEILYTGAIINSVCEEVTGSRPVEVNKRNEFECTLKFPETVVITTIALQLQRMDNWSGVPARIHCMMAENADYLHRILKEREEMLKRQEELKSLVEKFSAKVDDMRESRSASPINERDLGPPSVVGREIGTPSVSRGSSVGLSNKPPKLAMFSGEEPTPKQEVTFDTWLFRVKTVRNQYTEVALREGIIRSLTGNAADLVRFLGPEANVEQIIEKLKRRYGTVANSHTLLQEFCKIAQEKGSNDEPKEKVNSFSIRLEGAFNRIRTRAPTEMTDEQAERSLRAQFWSGLAPCFRESLRYLYAQESSTFADLVAAAKEVEAEGKVGHKVSARQKSATVAGMDFPEEELSKLREELAILKAGYVHPPQGKEDSSKKDQKKGSKSEGKKDPRNQSGGPQTSSAGPFKEGQKTIICWHCNGWGHPKRECPTYLNSKGGRQEEGTRPPKGQDNQQTTSQ